MNIYMLVWPHKSFVINLKAIKKIRRWDFSVDIAGRSQLRTEYNAISFIILNLNMNNSPKKKPR